MWGCYSAGYEEYCMACSPVDVQGQIVSQRSYHQEEGLLSCLAFSSALEIEAIWSFKISVNVYCYMCYISPSNENLDSA
jgi:hypothetical protein